MEPNRPFRWDLVRPDQPGSLLDGVDVPPLFFLDDLVECAARVLAQSGDGELYLVGRSVDSLYDLLSGALADTGWSSRLHPLPLAAVRRFRRRAAGRCDSERVAGRTALVVLR